MNSDHGESGQAVSEQAVGEHEMSERLRVSQPRRQRTIRLTDEEYETLILALGFATGVAMKQHETKIANSFIRVANAVARDQIAAEEERHEGGRKG